MVNTIDDVLIVGGGDIGLLTALSVQKLNPRIDVSIVDDFSRPVPQVGKSTFPKIQNILHGTLEIPEPRFIEEVKPIWKASVYFRDWCDAPEFHYPFDPPQKYPNSDTPDSLEHYYYYYDELYRSPNHLTKCEQIAEQGKSPWHYGSDGDLDRYERAAYHLDTERFNSFLRTICKERGISLINDEITNVSLSGSYLDAVHGESTTYDADLYVDASGFSRILRDEQGVAFRDFDFPLDAAYNVRVERDLADVVPATVVESGEYGWFWQIDTYDQRDLGYVFGSEYVDDQAALAEFLEFVEDVAPPDVDSIDPDTVERFAFSSGYYGQAWVDNCLAIGNAEGFVEPLQSTALTANASNSVQLARLLSAHGRLDDDALREAYNTTVERTWESIYDFIAAHYYYATGETNLWRAISSMDPSPRLERIIEEFDRYGHDWSSSTATAEDLVELHIFSLPDFYTIMRSMGASSVFYETNDFEVSKQVRRQEDQKYKAIRKEVRESYISAEELYRGVLDI